MDAAESEVQVKEVIRAVRDISWNEAATALLTLAVGLAVIKIVMHLARRATARFAQLPQELVKEIVKEITALDFVDAIYYDLTNKPPATFGWE